MREENSRDFEVEVDDKGEIELIPVLTEDEILSIKGDGTTFPKEVKHPDEVPVNGQPVLCRYCCNFRGYWKKRDGMWNLYETTEHVKPHQCRHYNNNWSPDHIPGKKG